MASRVALVMAPLLPRICRGVGNMGLKTGGGVQGGGENWLLPPEHKHLKPKSNDKIRILHTWNKTSTLFSLPVVEEAKLFATDDVEGTFHLLVSHFRWGSQKRK